MNNNNVGLYMPNMNKPINCKTGPNILKYIYFPGTKSIPSG